MIPKSAGKVKKVGKAKSVINKGKPKNVKNIKKDGNTGDVYKVRMVLRASLSSEDYPPVTTAQLAKHLKKYFSPIDVSELLEYGRTDLMKKLKLTGVTLTFEVPKKDVKRRLGLESASALGKWLVNHSLADGAWESGTSNFFVMKDDKTNMKYPPEIATISPDRDRIRVIG